MFLKLVTISTLSWTLVAAVILGLVTCESSTSSETSSSSGQQHRSARKFLEVEDLNQAPASFSIHDFASAEEVDGVEARLVESHARPKKFAKRSTQLSEKNQLTRQQQLQEGRPRLTRQNQQKKQRPGFFWTLARVTFETFNDTRSAIQQIGQIINEAIPAEPARKPMKKPVPTKKPLTNKTSSLTTFNGTTTTPAPTTTTEAEFILTRPVLFSLLRRNVKGLVRLFNIEWRDALNQSEKNVQEFRRDLGKQIGIYLRDNPDAY